MDEQARQSREIKITETIGKMAEIMEEMNKILRTHNDKIKQLEEQVLELTRNYDGH